METKDMIEKEEEKVVDTRTKKRTVKAIKKFPSHSIEEALKIPQLIKENNGGNPWDTEQLAKALNLKKGGNIFYYLTAASRDYGFTTGTRDTKTVELNELGRKYVYAQSQEDLLNSIKKAFLNIDLFKRVYEYYKGDEPTDEIFFRNALVSTFGIDETLHDDFIKVYNENRRFIDRFDSQNTLAEVKNVTQEQLTQSNISVNGNEKKIFVIMPFSEKTGKYQKGFFAEVFREQCHLVSVMYLKWLDFQ